MMDYYDDLWNPGPGSVGAAHSISSDAENNDVVTRLHQVVEEITGKPVEVRSKKIGFY